MKRALAMGVLVLFAATPAAAGTDRGRELAATSAKVVFVDVGQGDGVIIRVGEGSSSVTPASRAEPTRWTRRSRILGRITTSTSRSSPTPTPITSVAFSASSRTSSTRSTRPFSLRHPYYQGTGTNRDVIRALTERGAEIIEAKKGDVFTWGGASWRILSPPAGAFAGSGEEANASLAFRLRTRGSDLLFTGDIEKDAWRKRPQRRGRENGLLAVGAARALWLCGLSGSWTSPLGWPVLAGMGWYVVRPSPGTGEVKRWHAGNVPFMSFYVVSDAALP